jgi:hypothetical protein
MAACSLVQVTARQIACKVADMREAWLDGFSIAVRLATGDVRNLSSFETGLTLQRPRLDGTQNASLFLPQQPLSLRLLLPYWTTWITTGNAGVNTCLPGSAFRCWVGSIEQMAYCTLQSDNITILCPSLYVQASVSRLTIEVCKLFNVTSDGAAPLNAVNVSSGSQYLWPWNIGLLLGLSPTQLAFTFGTNAVNYVYLSGNTFFLAKLASDPLLTVAFGSTRCTSATLNATAAWIRCSIANSDIASPYYMKSAMQMVYSGAEQTGTLFLEFQAVPIIIAAEPSHVSKDDTVMVTGKYLASGSIPPAVYIGSQASGRVVVIHEGALLVSVPSIPPSDAGYPTVPIKLISPQGFRSTNTTMLTLLSELSVDWESTEPVTALPSAQDGSTVFPLNPTPQLRVNGRGSVTCRLLLNCPSDCDVGTGNNAGVAFGSDARRLAGVGNTAVTVAIGSFASVLLAFTSAGITGPAACQCYLAARCQDSFGRIADTVSRKVVSTASMTLQWQERVNTGFAAPIYPGSINISSALIVGIPLSMPQYSRLFSCIAALVPGTKQVTWTDSLSSQLSASDRVAQMRNATWVDAGAIQISFDQLITGALQLEEGYDLHTECTWRAAQEYYSLPIISFTTARLEINLGRYEVQAEAYTLETLPVDLVTSAAGPFPADAGTCWWTTINSTVHALQLSSTSLDNSYKVSPSGRIGGDVGMSLLVEGPPNEILFVAVTCTLWEQTFTSAPVKISTKPFVVDIISSANLIATPSGVENMFYVFPAIQIVATCAVTVTCSVGVMYSHSSCTGIHDQQLFGEQCLIPARVLGDVIKTQSPAAGQTLCTLVFDAVAVQAAADSTLDIFASCVDSFDRFGVSPHNISAVTPPFRAVWSDFHELSSAFIGTLPQLEAQVTVPNATNVGLPVASILSCYAYISSVNSDQTGSSAPATLLTAYSKDTAPDMAWSSTSDTIKVVFRELDTSSCDFNATYYVLAECTWLPTRQTIALATIRVTTVSPSINIECNTAQVRAYKAAYVNASLPMPTPSESTASCKLVMLASTSSTLKVSSSAAAETYQLTVNGTPPAITVLLEGTPGAVATLAISCIFMGKTLQSRSFTVRTLPFIVTAEMLQTNTWASGAHDVIPIGPVRVTTDGHGMVLCRASLTQESTDDVASPSDYLFDIGISGPNKKSLQGVTSVSVAASTTAQVTEVVFDSLGIRAAGGTQAVLLITCKDSTGRKNASEPFVVFVGSLRSSWVTPALFNQNVPLSGPLPPMVAIITIHPEATLPTHQQFSWLTCDVGLFEDDAEVAIELPLLLSRPGSLEFTSVAPVVDETNSAYIINITGLSLAKCKIGHSYSVHVECTWTLTGERVRMTTQTFQVPTVQLAWTSSSILLPADGNAEGQLEVATSSDTPALSTQPCSLRTLSASVGLRRLLIDVALLDVKASNSTKDGFLLLVSMQSNLPQSARASVAFVCMLWGQEAPHRASNAVRTK